jgi:hypothetical protein
MEHAEAVALIERISAAIENHDFVAAEADEGISWGTVGTMSATRRSLQEISDRLFAEGEYAPQAK